MKHQPVTSPHMAFCVAGAARTFATPLVVRHLVTNFIEPLSSPCGSMGSTPRASHSAALFLLLKTQDTYKSLGSVGFEPHNDRRSSISALVAALESPQLRPYITEAVILNGSGAVRDRDAIGWSFRASGRADNALRQADRTLWLRWRKPGRSRNGQSTPFNQSAGASAVTGQDEERLILNALNIAWCAGAIERQESTRGKGFRFDVVAYTRPDVVHWRPLKPWCEWGAELWTVAHVCELGGRDGVWLVPRSHLGRLAGQAEVWHACDDSWGSRRIASGAQARYSCQTKAEELLSYVLRMPSPPVSRGGPKPTTSRPAGLSRGLVAELDSRSEERAVAGAMRLREDESHRLVSCQWIGTEKSWSVLRQVQRFAPQCPPSTPGGRTTTCERRSRHVCDVVLSPAYAQGVFNRRQEGIMGGLPVPTGMGLRRLFGTNNNSACREATTPYDEVVAKV